MKTAAYASGAFDDKITQFRQRITGYEEQKTENKLKTECRTTLKIVDQPTRFHYNQYTHSISIHTMH